MFNYILYGRICLTIPVNQKNLLQMNVCMVMWWKKCTCIIVFYVSIVTYWLSKVPEISVAMVTRRINVLWGI